ncbi:MAG: enoyl-CoA hydratase/isomerase family protein [Myxococcota bacterium]
MADETRPFSIEHRQGVLYLTLDTPRCEVNIFNNAAARQLRDVLTTQDFATTRALVLQSGKEGSFVNGVGLLMAVSAQTPEAARDLSGEVRDAYQMLRDCPVPTIAAVRGNCYGCGVELALACDYRVAANTSVTHFYMTEVNDYLFLPIFEGTLRLPLLLGLERSADLLLWGQRWSAMQAQAYGLVDAVFDVDELAASTAVFAAKVVAQTAGRKPPTRRRPDVRDVAAIVDRQRRRIAQLPASYRPVYERTLELMARAVEAGEVTTQDRDDEILESGRSACAPMAKKALSFFFIRQVAHTLALGKARTDVPPLQVGFHGDTDALRELRADLTTHRVPATQVHRSVETLARHAGDATVCVVDGSLPTGEVARTGAHLLVLTPSTDEAAREHDGVVGFLHRPYASTGPALLELASTDRSPATTQRLYRYLTDAGFRVVVTRAGGGSALGHGLVAYFAPLVRFVHQGGAPSTIDASLRDFGVTKLPRVLLDHLDLRWLATALSASTGYEPADVARALGRLRALETASGSVDPRLVDGVCASLFAAASRWRARGTLRHPALADVALRELVDFPLQHGSLHTYMTRERLRAITGDPERLRPWVSEDDQEVVAVAATSRGAYA